jgi:mRNA deadenylase 3'-5' endonuclease subunit Ccr4
VDHLVSFNADIICLQEVPVQKFWTEIWSPKFRALNYTGIVQNVTRDHPVACAVLIRNAAFRVNTTESRSRALILVLDPCDDDPDTTNAKADPGPMLFLANVHLEAGRGEDEKRFSQIKSLLKRLDRKISATSQYNSVGVQRTTNCCPRIILAGDFNMLDSNPVYKFLSSKVDEKTTMRSSLDAIKVSGNSRTARRWPGSKELQSPFNASTTSRKVRGTILSQVQPLSFVVLPLREVFCQSTQSSLRTTFRGGCVLDYIWASWDDAKPWIVDDRVLQQSSGFNGPSLNNPSDHLPIGARFQLRNLT